MSLSIMSGLRKVRYFLYTCLLFTKSDIKTTLIPVSLLASASAPLRNVSRLPHVLFWVWLHLLQCDLSNQTMDPYEDEQNKNYRPLPAKRISLQEALRFRWYIVPACLVLSAMYSAEAVYASIALAGLTVLYNEFHAHRGHWVLRNLVNACGLASFELGATLIAGSNATQLDSVAIWSIAASTGIFATTIHSQDFKDVDGDRAIGRKTIPIVFGTNARWTVIFPLVLWSLCLSLLWNLDNLTSVAFTILGTYVGVLYMHGKTVEQYQVAFYWYNLWLSIAHSLPAYYRLRVRDTI